MNQDLALLLDRAARLAGQRVHGSRLEALHTLPPDLPEAALLQQAWQAVGLQGLPRPVPSLSPAQLPAISHHATLGWLLLQTRDAQGLWQAQSLDNRTHSLPASELGPCFSLPARTASIAGPRTAAQLVRQALLTHRRTFMEAALATLVCSLLTLGTSLFSMQVYDRVIPNQGFQTLWVLSVGAVMAVLLEMVLKHVRSHSVDQVGLAIDQSLSSWLFQRMMRIRMEARPPSVGTLAAQVKGFELVRSVLASTSLFVLTDVPFAVLFIAMIGLIGGWMLLVPLVTVPICLVAGLVFQRAIQNLTRRNLSAANRKAGLLVEAVDGAESLKAQSAEWKLLARWDSLCAETAITDEQVRNQTAWSQHITVALQQLGYIALVALGAWLVANNELTMGGLLACTIISNRAMMPIVQLPGVMAQWAHARAAMEGLDQIIQLPSEADDEAQALAPQALDAHLRLERLRFCYVQGHQPALDVLQLDIRPGERVGLLGAIGSGKSTLLKMLSGLYRPAEGKVYLGGMDMASLATPVLREHLGYLPQDARLFSGTLRDNLLLGLPDPGDEAILQAARRSGLIELVSSQPRGLALVLGEGGRGVSGGQKQLILMTRALLAGPKVWLLDEPTGAMDSVTEARVVQLLSELAQQGATIVAATHKTAMLPLFDRLIVMQGGRIVADGPRELVLAKLAGRPVPQALQEKRS